MGAVTETAGHCTQGFSNKCPSGGTCDCFTASAAKFTSSGIGKGDANVFATVDVGGAYGSLGTDCMPVYAEIDVIAKKDSPSFAVVGAACFDPKENIVSNGAMGLESSDLFVTTGYATYTATIESNRLVLKFSGAAE